jgi:hypothetical protein
VSIVLSIALAQTSRAGYLGQPVSAVQQQIVYTPDYNGQPQPSYFYNSVNTKGFQVLNNTDPRTPYGVVYNIGASVSLSSITPQETVILRLRVFLASVAGDASSPLPVGLLIGLDGANEALSPPNFPPSIVRDGTPYVIPSGDYRQQPYVLDIDVTREVQMLLSDRYKFVDIFVGPGYPSAATGPYNVEFAFSVPEPSSLALSLIAAAAFMRFRLGNR